MRQAIIYTRSSPRPSVGHCMSCEFQEEKAREYCDYRGFDVLETFEDRALAGKRYANRPGLCAAMVKVCKARGILVVYNLARLPRSLHDLIVLSETLQKHDADLALVTEHVDTTTPMGLYYFPVMAILGQWQRVTTAEHASAILLNMQKNGRRVSSQPPYGYEVDPYNEKRLVPNMQEIRSIRLVVNLRNQGMSLQDICFELTRRGRKPRGKVWYPKTVSRILDRLTD